MKKRIIEVHKRLLKKYGIPGRQKVPPDPVDMLIATILSQNTNDRNSFKAYQNLKRKYSSWDKVSKQSREEIEETIRVAGLGKQKSHAIKNFLSSIKKEYGEISLEHLKKLSDDEILAKLISFPGVGIKTASCVLQFSLKRNICPVDTHVHRTVNRIGILKASSPDKTFYMLKENMPDKIAHAFHTNLIRLGREICKPSKPLCSICPAVDICEYEDKNFDPAVYKANEFMLLDSIT